MDGWLILFYVFFGIYCELQKGIMESCSSILDRISKNTSAVVLLQLITWTVQLNIMKLVNIVILVSTWEFDPPSSLTMNSLNVEDMTVDTLLRLCRSQSWYDSNAVGLFINLWWLLVEALDAEELKNWSWKFWSQGRFNLFFCSFLVIIFI